MLTAVHRTHAKMLKVGTSKEIKKIDLYKIERNYDIYGESLIIVAHESADGAGGIDYSYVVAF
jgi:hypothetical protein